MTPNTVTGQGIYSAVIVAGTYARLGENERALEWLEKAFAARDANLSNLKVDTSFDNLRSDPRFAELMRKVGLPQ